MKILITNDDGVDAPGLEVLARCAAQFGEVTIAAPHQQRSSCGHHVTTDRPLRWRQHKANWFAIEGTPADCVRVGVHHLLPDCDWVMAGVNDGGNLGVDVVMSGTVAAVREATLLGRPAIAFSQYRKAMRPRDWTIAERFTTEVLRDIMSRTLEPHSFWNVNFPDPDPHDAQVDVIHCDMDMHPLPMQFHSTGDGELQYRSMYHSRPRRPGSDVDVCFGGNVAVSKLAVFRSV